MILISILEVFAVVALIVGFVFEKKVIAFEERVADKFKELWRRNDET